MIIQFIVNGQSAQYDLNQFGKSTVTFGRGENCDIRLNLPFVSRSHGSFQNQNGQWYLVDQGSTVGTWYQGSRVSYPVPLQMNAAFEIPYQNNPAGTLYLQVIGQSMQPQPFSPAPQNTPAQQYPPQEQYPPQQEYYPPQDQYPPQQEYYPPQDQYTPAQQYPPPGGDYIPPEGGYAPQPSAVTGETYFDGTGGQFIGMLLLNSLVLIVTCGIMYPWVVVRNMKWRKSHTVINGRRLVFTGTTGELWGNWIKWWLLTLVTCGIYSFWVSVRMLEWEMEHTGYEDQLGYDGQVFETSFYDGEVGERLGQQLVANLLTGLSCGIAYPWMMVRIQKFDMAHSVICGDRLQFNGDGAGFWGENFLVNLLTGITCGIYRAWGVCRINKWVFRHTTISSTGNRKRLH